MWLCERASLATSVPIGVLLIVPWKREVSSYSV